MDLFLIFLFATGSVICHQLPERSFFVDGWQLPVCARCTGLYLSGAAGLAGWLAVKLLRGWRPQTLPPASAPRNTSGGAITGPARWAMALLLIAAAPTVVSYLTGVLGLWDGSNLTRAVLAVPLGVVAGVVVAAVGTKDLR
jgi:uncharacterized membrane protein